MKKGACFILCILLFVACLNAQSNIDSLKTLLETDLADSARIDILLSLSSSVSSQDEALTYGNEANRLAEQFSFKDRQAQALKNIGLVHFIKGDYLQTLEFYRQSLELYRANNNLVGISNILNNIGAIYNNQSDDAKAIEYFLESLRYAEEAENTYRIGTALLNVGVVYSNQPQNFEQGKDFLRRSVQIFEKMDAQLGIGVGLLNLGNILMKQEKLDSALYYLEQSKEIFILLSDDYYHSYTLSLIGEVYIEKGDYQAAIRTHQEAVKVAERQDAKAEIGQAILGLANSYKEQKNNPLAQLNYFRAEEIFSDLGIKSGLTNVYKGLADTYENLSDYRNAYRYHQLYSNFKDTLYNVATADEVKNLSFTYELEKKEAEIEQLNIENKLQEAQVQKARALRNFFIALGVLFCLVAAAIVVQFRITKQNRERKQALDQQTKINQQLQQIDKLKDQFLANTSHELRTPLHGIIGLADSLIDGVAGQLPKNAVDNLEMIASSGKRLSNLVNDILDFSKLKNFDIELLQKPVSIHALVDIILKNNAPLTRGKKLELINAAPENLPAAFADENRLQQVLYNLIGNAIKFTQTGHVKVSAIEKEGLLQIGVEDTGMGIPENKFEAIFQEFEQGDGSISREFRGTGLGLSISKQLVELQGGKMWVESQVGKGSTFFFTLPASTEKATTLILAPKAAGLTRQAIPLKDTSEAVVLLTGANDSIRILVVDDEPINQQVLKNHLSGQGFQLTQAMNGAEAIKAIQNLPPFDLVLLDVMMPRMSGYEVCQKIRDKYLSSELPVIMVTAKNQLQDIVQGLSLGANDYLPKPFHKEELLARINTQLDLHRIFAVAGRFVPSEFLHALNRERITEVVLGDYAEKEVTVLFTDIRDYTSLSETMTPEENFKFVNAFHGRMGPVIQKHGGFVNQYLGDAIMAIFPKSPENALQAAVELQGILREYNAQRYAQNRQILKMGVGLHTGSLIMGIIGDQKRMDAATIADTVNTASRIESLTKHYGASILLSGDSLQKMQGASGTDEKNLQNSFHLRNLGQVQVKGKKEPVGIYECYDGDEPGKVVQKLETIQDFEKGLTHFYAREFPEASAAFNQVLKANPVDHPARLFLNKSSKYTIEGAPEDWTGVEIMTFK